jgi:glutamate/tyrosine decarboxylase-like PLP-dependent enzyme
MQPLVRSAMSETSAWFGGPKGENGDWFAGCVEKILNDYYSWRRNYFPEDGLVLDAESRRAGEAFQDRFDDRLFELLAKLKADFPFQSPRYAAHMVAEQTLPSIAGYFAAMLYNPNNVTSEAAPVTVRLELEAARMISKMIGYGEESWAHLTSGGTVANIEALWMARTVKYLPLVVSDMRRQLGVGSDSTPFGAGPDEAFAAFARVFEEAPKEDVIRAYVDSEHNVVERGFAGLLPKLGSRPVVLAPETQHYSIKKALDVLGLGRRSLITVRVDNEFRMDVEDLRSKLDDVDKRGDHVIAVIPIIGTTEEGAVDPLDKIIQLRADRKNSFWIHADAAYGGYLRTVTLPDRLGLGEPRATVQTNGQTRELALQLPVGATCDALEALQLCDSVTIDPHKLGYIPYPAGAICFKSDVVKPLARQDAPYIEDVVGDVETERRSESVGVYILEGSKPGAAAAAVWLSHKLIPLDKSGHGRLIQEGIRNACELHALLDTLSTENDKVSAVNLCAPGSNILCFAFRAKQALPLSGLNELNRLIYQRFNVSEQSGKRVYDQPFFLSRTSLHPAQYSYPTVAPFLERLGVSHEEYEHEGVFLLRSVLMNPWYGEAKRRGRYFISELVEELYRNATELLAEQRRATPEG